MNKLERRKLEKEVRVEWQYPAVPKPEYHVRMYHPSGAYIHVKGKDNKKIYEQALLTIFKKTNG